MTKLSVNINKVAVIRNSRGGNVPDLLKVAQDCESFGADGITVHPRPDQRHIRYSDVYELKEVLKTEFNIEGYPSTDFIKMVVEVKPAQVTLVPDPPNAITSNAGWDTINNFLFLKDVVSEFKRNNIRTSIFTETEFNIIENAAKIGSDRIELYTEAYAKQFENNKYEALKPYQDATSFALSCGLKVNAGHDLNLQNLKYFSSEIPQISEVSIGHALISDALYYGLANTIQMYKNMLVK